MRSMGLLRLFPYLIAYYYRRTIYSSIARLAKGKELNSQDHTLQMYSVRHRDLVSNALRSPISDLLLFPTFWPVVATWTDAEIGSPWCLHLLADPVVVCKLALF